MQVILKHEGGLSDDKNDAGGITNYGISLRFLKLNKIDVDGDGDVDRDDVIHLTKDEATRIYLKQWWDKYDYRQINAPAISTKVMDGSVNMGAKQIHKIVQRALNKILPHPIVIDGSFGKQTYYAINSVNAFLLLQKIREEEKLFYLHIINTHTQYACFKKGWLARAAS